jgi:aryl-alcohol dehydrogenase-like predicted oxidoreductase
VLLLHRAHHLTDWEGAAWRRLLELRSDGVIGVLGVSVQSPGEAKAALANSDVTHIQLGCNILDARWEEAGIPALAAARPDVTIHARSALLQGVLLADDAGGWPKIDGLDWRALATWLRETAAGLGRWGVADLCYAYLRALPWLDGVVVGMASRAHLDENLALFACPALSAAQAAAIARLRPAVPAALLNPALWPQT